MRSSTGGEIRIISDILKGAVNKHINSTTDINVIFANSSDFSPKIFI